MTQRILRLGTRGSQLARWQANWVAQTLQSCGLAVEILEITTQGDAQQSPSVGELGSVGVFTKEIQRALLDEQIDLAVHSLKDLPTTPVEGLHLAAVPPREIVNDALLSPLADTIEQLPQGAKVGTGSLRRQAQLRRLRPDLQLCDIRGNVDTRLRKLDQGQYDAIILAAAGLTRLGLGDRITQTIPTDQLLPAPGQGALGIECRVTDVETTELLTQLNDPHAWACVTAERSMLARVEGGCLAAIGAQTTITDGRLHLTAVVLSPDGTECLQAEGQRPLAAAAPLGHQVGDQLLSQGARRLVTERR